MPTNMPAYTILSIGSHPNISFYNWRLQTLKNVYLESISMISGDDDTVSQPHEVSYNWSSNQFGNDRFTLKKVYSSIESYANYNSSTSIDYVLLSAASLQELSNTCSVLSSILSNQLSSSNASAPTIIVESTNFVNLEPFVKMSLQLDDRIPIISIMSDFDIRELKPNNFLVNKSKKESELIYLGKSGRENSYTSTEIKLINKAADLFEAPNIDVYKLNTPLEFLSYQWKFALPKITIESLSIIFEKPFPIDLQNQILAKPLISGLIFEIITVIKTMGCKLFNSYDNEISLLERLSQLYPPVELSIDAFEAPKLYYDFFNQNQLYLDLLLLQPILIADDFQVKTPYLEFLYAVMSQYNTNNLAADDLNSIFWIRKNSKNMKLLKSQKDEIVNKINYLELEKNKKMNEINSLNNNITDLNNTISHMSSSTNHSSQQQIQYQQPAVKSPPSKQMKSMHRSSTDPAIDPEMEELSEMATSFGLSNKTPPTQSREYMPSANNNVPPKSSNGVYQQQQPNFQQPLQPAFTNQTGRSSPNFTPQQNLPHGLPPQGLPPHHQIFNTGNSSGHTQRRGYPPSGMTSNGIPPNAMPPNGMPPMQYQQGPPAPMSNLPSRDDISFMSTGRASSFMGGSSTNLMQQSQQPSFDNSFSSMNNSIPGNRQFKPTSRKSSRKSTAVMTNSIVGFNDINARAGMPSSRHSMNPNMNGLTSSRMSTMGIPQSRKPNNMSQMQFGQELQQQNTGGYSQQQGNGGYPQQKQKYSPPSMNPALGKNNEKPTSNGSTTSLTQLQQQSQFQKQPSPTPELIPVPEATPAPTPIYTPSQENNNADKKKKRGFLGFGKKN